jgi:signal transduction histidine kinase/ligand-binding sensor domain-containing protein
MLNGLVSDNIHSICQDSSGFIWIATGEGLSVFNSKSFQNYTVSDGLITDNITAVIPDRSIKNKMWIGTNGKGITVFENGVFKNISSRLKEDNYYISTIFQLKNNVVCCGTGEGFFFIKNNKIEIPDYSINTNQVYSFTGRNNELWVGTDKGLFIVSNNLKTLKQFPLPGDTGKVISSIFCDKNNNVWAFSPTTGYIYKIDSDYKLTSFNLGCNDFSTDLLEDNSNYIWISTSNGLYRFDISDVMNSLTRFTTDNGLLQNNVSSILLDRENILWVAANDNGLSKLADLNLYDFRNDSKNTGSWSTSCSDKNNHFWASINTNLVELYKNSHNLWEKYSRSLPGEFQNENINKIICDDNNNLYLCSSSGDIQIYKIIEVKNSHSILKKSETVDLKETATGNKLYTILVDKSGNIWCSILDKGIILLDEKNHNRIKEIYTDKDGIPDNSVRSIYQDSMGNLWFGGYDGGLSEFTFSKNNSARSLVFVNHFTKNDGLPNNDIRSITEKDGKILIGTRYGGLAVFKNGKFNNISRNAGLSSDAIWSIAVTPSHIWLGTQAGVQSLQNNLTISNELSEVIPGIPFYSISSSENGNLCFVSASDFYVYEPSSDSIINYHPPVYLTRLLVNGHERKLNDRIELPSNENTLTFEFQGIMNRNESESTYEYRLINKNDSWKFTTNNNSVTYSILNPGTYTFQVEALNFKHIKSGVPAQFTFTIDSPFYQQWWFYLFILIFVSLIIYLLIRLRLKRLLEIEKIRTRIASDLHDEIGSGLTHIAMLSEYSLHETNENLSNSISDDKFSSGKSLERIGKISRNLIDSMIDVIWAIDPKFDSLNDFIFNFKAYANEICESKNVKILFNTDNIDKIKVNSRVKRCLQLISKEALNNSLKYSECTQINYHLNVKNKIICLKISDNGKGFDKEKVKYGNGIKNMKKNVEELTGSFNIMTNGPGTFIEIRFPINS